VRNEEKMLVGEPEGRDEIAWETRRRWDDNIKMELKEVG
jgi:hypothetical protein